MGQLYSFECPNCSYEARVSGGGDRGFEICTTTISCEQCQKLYDVVASKLIYDAVTGKAKLEKEPIHCPVEK